MEIQDYNQEKKQNNRYSKAIKALLAVFCTLIIGFGTVAYILYDELTSEDYDDPSRGSLFLDRRVEAAGAIDAAVQQTAPQETPQSVADIEYGGKEYIRNENIVNILFLGIDTNTERKIARKGYRSDMVMVCAIDAEKKKATLISIPRDTLTTIYKVDEDTGQVTDTLQQKINTAYAYGGGATKYSYENAMACVQMFLERRNQLEEPLGFTLDIPIYMYAGIDMDGITKVASAVGGVELTLEKYIPGVGSKGQTVLLKYSNAEEYLRNRHDTGGDLDRARRQQKFMVALAKKIKSMGAADIILSLYDELQKYVYTNLDTGQMMDFAKLLMDLNIDGIQVITVPGTGKGSKAYYYYHDEKATLDLLLDVYYEEMP